VKISIIDNGTGVPNNPENNSNDLNIKGLNTSPLISLSVCKYIVEQQKSKLEIENLNPSGTCFIITL